MSLKWQVAGSLTSTQGGNTQNFVVNCCSHCFQCLQERTMTRTADARAKRNVLRFTLLNLCNYQCILFKKRGCICIDYVGYIKKKIYKTEQF